MSDKMKVYSKVSRTLKKWLPTSPENQVIVLGMLVASIVAGKKAQLSEMSLHIPHPAQPASLAKRLQRFVTNDRVDVAALYLPFAADIIAHLADKPLFLALDGSQVGRGCMTLMVAVIYKKRAIPLVWLAYKGKKGHTTGERHIEALKLAHSLIPEGTQVTLLGDAEYDTVEMLSWLQAETDWDFVVRTEPRILLTKGEIQYPIRRLLLGRSCRTWVNDVAFTQQMFGPVTAVAWWDAGYEKPIYLISSLTQPNDICHAYAKRFKIETLFSDQKSRGFQIHKSHLSDPQRLARLLLAACLAYIWLVYLGVEVTQDESRRRLIDRPNRTDKSLFRLGFDWLKFALTRDLDFNVLFHPPGSSLRLGVR